MGNTESDGLDSSQLGQLTDEQISSIVAQPTEEFDDPMKYVLRDYFTENNFVWRRWRSPPEWGLSIQYPSTWTADPQFIVATIDSGPFQGAVAGTQKFGELINAELSIKRFDSVGLAASETSSSSVSSSSTKSMRSMTFSLYTEASLDDVNAMIKHMDGKFEMNEECHWKSLDIPAHRVQVAVVIAEDGFQLESVSYQQWAVKDNVAYQLIFSYPRSCAQELRPIICKMIESCRFL